MNQRIALAERILWAFLLTVWFSVALYAQEIRMQVPQASQQQSAQQTKRVDPLSVRSLYLEIFSKDQFCGSATGIVVEYKGKQYLITNWHVLSGRNPETNNPLNPSGYLPDQINILHHSKVLGTWVVRTEALLEPNGSRRWIEHKQGSKIDVAALPLTVLDNQVQIYPFDLALAETDMLAVVAMPVSIIGFPLGLAGPGFFPIWKTGHIASDTDLDYAGLPCFLIDATTRGGMSGSPVLLRLTGGFETKSGGFVLAGGGIYTKFLGLYSGRLHDQSEIGRVWRPQVITETLSQIK